MVVRWFHRVGEVLDILQSVEGLAGQPRWDTIGVVQTGGDE